MAMILDPTVGTLSEYLRLKKEQLSKNKHRLLVPERPRMCPECGREECFWVKGYYFRWVVEADLEEVLPIPRYVCRYCRLVVSVLFSFLVPYRQFTKRQIGQGIQKYLLVESSYRQVAGETAGNCDEIQRPNHSQVWHWVRLIARRAAKNLNVVVQRACAQAGREIANEVYCPNAVRAQSEDKVLLLNSATRLLALAEGLLQQDGEVVGALQTYFADFVKPAQSILTGYGIRLIRP